MARVVTATVGLGTLCWAKGKGNTAVQNRYLYLKECKGMGPKGFVFQAKHLHKTDANGIIWKVDALGGLMPLVVPPSSLSSPKPWHLQLMGTTTPKPPGIKDWEWSQRFLWDSPIVKVWDRKDVSSPRGAKKKCLVCGCQAKAKGADVARCYLHSQGGPMVQIPVRYLSQCNVTRRLLNPGTGKLISYSSAAPWSNRPLFKHQSDVIAKLKKKNQYSAAQIRVYTGKMRKSCVLKGSSCRSRIGPVGCQLTCNTMLADFYYFDSLPDKKRPTPVTMNRYMSWIGNTYDWTSESPGIYNFLGKPPAATASVRLKRREMPKGSIVTRQMDKDGKHQHRLLAKIDELIDFGIPVMVDVVRAHKLKPSCGSKCVHCKLAKAGKGTHFVLVVGRYGKKFLLNDPGFGRPYLDWGFNGIAGIRWLEKK